MLSSFKKVVHVWILKLGGDYSVPLYKYLHYVVVIWHLLKQVLIQPVENNQYICTAGENYFNNNNNPEKA